MNIQSEPGTNSMLIDLQSLSTDTLLYMLMHSGAFVMFMGVAFFMIGLMFGFATWGRHKSRSRVMAAEIVLLREEIATLKRKLGEQNVKPGASQIATETIAMSSPTAGGALQSVEFSPSSPALPKEVMSDSLSRLETAHDIESGVNGDTMAKSKSGRSKSLVKIKPHDPKAADEPASLSCVEPAIIPVSSTAIGRSGLMPVTPPTPDASAHSSPLAAIIASAPSVVDKTDKSAGPTLAADAASFDIIPALPELPPAPPPSYIKPEVDPRLGLVYKSPPPHCDDLTAMTGIARVLEQRLHEFGIYTYFQIASWTDEHIREFSSRLAFKDRIHREKWVEQARKLHAERHGAAVISSSKSF